MYFFLRFDKMKISLLSRLFILMLFGVSLASMAKGWWVNGHATLTEAAASALPDDMPEFFRNGGKALAHFVGDPDRWKNPTSKFLRASSSADHFLDLEDVEGKDLPSDRYKAIELLNSIKKRPENVGMLPYAILENYERLACAFYDFRKLDKNTPEIEKDAIKWKCLLHAGVMAHFTTDLCMPLHTTVNYDGKKIDGKIKQKGIHARIDSFPEKFEFKVADLAKGLKANKLDPDMVWNKVIESIRDSHRHVETCYEFDKQNAFVQPNEESKKFITERCRMGVQLTMDIWYSAWLKSATMPKHY